MEALGDEEPRLCCSPLPAQFPGRKGVGRKCHGAGTMGGLDKGDTATAGAAVAVYAPRANIGCEPEWPGFLIT
jgi:hypothetical protein